jgi:hypothetical protein
MNDEQIKHMVDRFLMWHLPTDFNPDNGISFDKRLGISTDQVRSPVGTNLLTAAQADEMVRHMLKGLPETPA